MASSSNRSSAVVVDQPSNETPKPIVFVSRGRPDVCLTVFSQEFHVHATVLQLHSKFFFKFLDSPDKASLPSIDSRFKYTWVTKSDEDGEDWSLICARPKTGYLDPESFQGSTQHEIGVFHSFLQALYDVPYTISCPDELVTLTKFADFYRALLKISRSISAAIQAGDPDCDLWMLSKPEEVITAAVQLRHKNLLIDGFIHYRCRHSDRYYELGGFNALPALQNSDLLKLHNSCMKRLELQIAKVHGTLFEDSAKFFSDLDEPKKIEFMEKVWIEMSRAARIKGTPASMYREVDNRLWCLDFEDDDDFGYEGLKLEREMRMLLANDLHFNRTHVSGTGKYLDNFLCNFINDEDLPWDREEISW